MLHVASGDAFGGAESVVVSLCTAQRASGIKVSALVLNEGDLAAALRAAEIEVAVADEATLGLIRLVRALQRIAAVREVTVIHAHRYKEVVLAALARLTGCTARVIRTIHGGVEHKHGVAAMKRRLSHSLEQLVGIRCLDAVVCVSREMQKSAAQIYRRQPVIYIPNGIPVSQTIPHASDTAVRACEGMRAVVFCGRLVEVKRVDIFIEMAKRVCDERSDVCFQIVGDGPLKSQLSTLLDAPYCERIQFLGFRRDVHRVLSQAEILVLTSDAEGMPVVALEAMAAGAIVVARAVGALPEVLAEGSAGVIVFGDDPAVYAREVIRILDEPNVARALRTAAGERVRNHYSAEAMARSYERAYRDALSAAAIRPVS